MKRRCGYFYLTMWWFVLLAVLGVLIVFFTPEWERISQDENRVLQNLPELSVSSFFSGKYTEEFERFLSDSIPGRNSLIYASDGITQILSVNTSEDNFYLDTTMKEAAEYQGDGADEPESNENADKDNSDDPDPGSGKDKSVDAAKLEILHKDGGSTVVYTYSEENLRLAAENIEKVVDAIPGDGNVYVTFVPFPVIAFRFTDSLDVNSGWRCDHIEKLDQLTSERVKCFDSLEILEPHMLAGEQLFLHISHQWHIKGAYYVFCEMIKAQGLTPTPYDEYEYRINRPSNPKFTQKDSFELLYPLDPAHNYRVRNITEREEVPLMYYPGADNGSYLYGNLNPWHTVVTGFHTGRNALIFGDCFNLSFSTFLLPYYDELHFVDVRYGLFDRKGLGTSVVDMMQRNSIDDVYMVFSEAHGINSSTFLYGLPEHLY